MKYILQNKTLPSFFGKIKTDKSVLITSSVLTSNPINALHYHNMAEFGICISGEGETYIENRIYKFSKGCIQILPPNISHLSKAKNGVTSKWIWIQINMRKLFLDMGFIDPDSILCLADDNNLLCGVYDENEYPNLTNIIREIANEQSIDDDSLLFISASVCKLLILCKRLKSNDATLNSIRIIPGQNNKILPVIEYISENLDNIEGLSEAALSKLINISVSTLRRQFKQHTDMPPKEFIIRSRMAYAEYLLRKTDLSVSEISMRVGYNEIAGFNRTFKRFFEVSPSKYRKNNK